MSLLLQIQNFGSQEKINFRKTVLRVLLGICCLFSVFILTACGETVDEYSRRAQTKLNDDLRQSNHPLRRHVEDAHVTVNAKEAYVSNFHVITKDGSKKAGRKGSNIKEVQADIVVRWDGVIHKNGETVLSVAWDVSSGKSHVKKAKITKTDALVNTKDPGFWLDVAGACIILLL